MGGAFSVAIDTCDFSDVSGYLFLNIDCWIEDVYTVWVFFVEFF